MFLINNYNINKQKQKQIPLPPFDQVGNQLGLCRESVPHFAKRRVEGFVLRIKQLSINWLVNTDVQLDTIIHSAPVTPVNRL